jgi:hypothetical protein
VSTNAATLVEFLPRPAAIAVYHWAPTSSRLSLSLPACRGIEDSESLLAVGSGWRDSRRQDPDDIPGRLPFDFVTRPDVELIGNGLGQRHLQLARDLGHDLTLARKVCSPARRLEDPVSRSWLAPGRYVLEIGLLQETVQSGRASARGGRTTRDASSLEPTPRAAGRGRASRNRESCPRAACSGGEAMPGGGEVKPRRDEPPTPATRTWALRLAPLRPARGGWKLRGPSAP